MPLFKYDITPKAWAALETKAAREKTTVEAMLQLVIAEFCAVCVSQLGQERRNKLIGRVVALTESQLNEIEHAVTKAEGK